MKPAVEWQGKVVIEADGDGFLIMFPDGEIVGASTRTKAEAKARQWFKEHVGKSAIGVGEIEWRGA
jgi:hypothetical protein